MIIICNLQDDLNDTRESVSLFPKLGLRKMPGILLYLILREILSGQCSKNPRYDLLQVACLARRKNIKWMPFIPSIVLPLFIIDTLLSICG